MQCSVMALAVKLGLVILGGVSLIRLSGTYQERLDRHGELAAVVARYPLGKCVLEWLLEAFPCDGWCGQM